MQKFALLKNIQYLSHLTYELTHYIGHFSLIETNYMINNQTKSKCKFVYYIISQKINNINLYLL